MTDPWEIRVERNAMGCEDDPPERIFLGGRAINVVEVIESWFGADHAYHNVRAADEATCILREDVAGRWRLIMVDRLPTSV